jgi:uncharacterized membrane protein
LVKAARPEVGQFLLVLAVAALLRLVLAARQDLWADELFSLAMATGHSLEHPASRANPELGDFVEPIGAVSPASFRRYLEQESPPAGSSRVIRAVLLSDTSPPLYYLALAAGTRIFGTGDFAVHAVSVIWACATLPLIWLLGVRLAGRREALLACILFALAPVSLYYAVEARMYAMLWFFSALTAWLTLRLSDRGQAGTMALWVGVSAAGLLTHYFYVFVWAASITWLLLHPDRCSRTQLVGVVVLVLLLIAPWYRLVPQSLNQWRVTGHWLDGRPPVHALLTAPFTLGWSLFSGRGVWGGNRFIDDLSALLVLVIGVALLRRGRAAILSNGRDLVWLWVIAVCVGPVLFDLSRGTATSMINRYALAGVPGAMLLVALAIGTLPSRWVYGATALLTLTWIPGYRDIFSHRARAGEPYRRVAAKVAAWARPGDLLIVHAIPSGVVGVARYLHREVPMVAWVGQLEQRRMPGDLTALLQGHSRVALIRIHDVGAPAPEEAWLRANATVQGEASFIVYFTLPSTRR